MNRFLLEVVLEVSKKCYKFHGGNKVIINDLGTEVT